MINTMETTNTIDTIFDDEQLFRFIDIMKEKDKNQNQNQNNDEENILKCKCLNSENQYEDKTQGIVVCQKCGSVLSSVINNNQDWKSFDDNNTNARCSSVTNPFYPQSSLGTTIAGNGFRVLKMIQKWQQMPYRERALYKVCKHIEDICRNNKVLKCIEDDTKIIYKNISETKNPDGSYVIVRGINRKSLIAACLFFAYKKNNQARNIKEISIMFNINFRELTKGCKIFMRLLRMNISTFKVSFEINTTKPEQFVLRYHKMLDLDKKYIPELIDMTKNINKLHLASTHTSSSIALCVVIMLLKHYDIKMIKRDISKTIGISEVTVIKTHKKLMPYKDIIMSNTEADRIAILIKNKRENAQIPVKLPKIDINTLTPINYIYRTIDVSMTPEILVRNFEAMTLSTQFKLITIRKIDANIAN